MRKLGFITVLIMCVSVVYAQEKEKSELPKNEIAVSIGDNMFYTQIIGESDNGLGSYSLSYHNRVTDWFWYGAYFNVFPTKGRYYYYYDYYGSTYQNNDSYTKMQVSLAPSVRFSYLNKPNITLYSGLSLGWGIVLEDNSNDNSLGLFFQATMFGFSFGKKFFIGGEIGIGYKGLYSLNAGYRF
jgi:hypothetical protein